MNVCVMLTLLLYLTIVHTLAPEVDFTDSVSLILHQLQQEQKPIDIHASSITVSEDETDDETDELDNESVVESTTNEAVDRTRQSSISSIVTPVDLPKSVQTDLSFSSHDKITFTKDETAHNQTKSNKKDEPVNINKKKPTTIPAAKKRNLITRMLVFFQTASFSAIERRPVTTTTTTTAAKRPVTNIVPRKTSTIPSKKGPTIAKAQLKPAASVASLGSQPSTSVISIHCETSFNIYFRTELITFTIEFFEQ